MYKPVILFLMRYGNAIMSIFQFIFLGKGMRNLKLRYDLVSVASKAAGKKIVASSVIAGEKLSETAGNTIVDVLEQVPEEKRQEVVSALDKESTHLKNFRISLSNDMKDAYLTYRGFGIRVDLATRKITPTIMF